MATFVNYWIGSQQDASCLPEPQRNEYLELVRAGAAGDTASIAQAMALLPCARSDVEAVRDTLAVLARQPQPKAAERALPKIESRLEAIPAEIAALVDERQRLLEERSEHRNTIGSVGAWKQRAVISANSPIVAACLRRELVKAGILEA